MCAIACAVTTTSTGLSEKEVNIQKIVMKASYNKRHLEQIGDLKHVIDLLVNSSDPTGDRGVFSSRTDRCSLRVALKERR